MSIIKRWLDSPAASRVVIIGMLGYFVWAGWLTLQNAHIVGCQAKYAESQAAATAQRAQAAQQDRQALDDMVNAIINAKAPTDSRTALLKYQNTRKEADAKRAANPLPSGPAQFCS